MDDQKKEQIISAIYTAISSRNYQCASTIFDDITKQMINEKLDEVIALMEQENLTELINRIRQLKYEF